MRFYRSGTLQRTQDESRAASVPKRGDEYIQILNGLRQQKIQKQRVVIIGAGMAGLCAAYELSNLGLEVVVLEAQDDHIGGRVRTYREPDGLYAEFGAMRIPNTHTLTRHYIHELGLQLRKFVQDNPKTFCSIRHHIFNRSNAGIEASKALFELREDEKNKKYDEIWADVILDIKEHLSDDEITDLFSVIPKTDKIRNLDLSSLHSVFHKQNVSEEAVEFVISHFGLETYLQTSLAEHLREEQENVWDTEGFCEIKGGTDMLAKQFYKHLEANVISGAQVYRVKQNADGATVSYISGGKDYELSCDWVICTAPLGVVTTMEFEGLSPQKQRAIRRINYDSSTKVLARVKRRFWETDDGIYGGGSIYDSALGHTWYPSDNEKKKDPEVSAGPAMLLASYTWGQAARRMDSIPLENLQHFITSELMKVHKTLRPDDIEKVVRWSWTEHPWSRGAFCFFNPGEHQFLYPFLKAPEDRTLFAGEHCSLSHSWIQGAFESAIDACQIIIHNLQSNEHFHS